MFFLIPLLLTLVGISVIYAWGVRSFPWLARRRRAAAIALASLFVVQTPLHWLVVAAHSLLAARLHTAIAVLLVLLGLASVPIGLLLLGSEAWSRVSKGAWDAVQGPAAERADEPTRMNRRQAVQATAGLGFLGATGSALGWGIVRGRHAFELSEVAVPIVGLPRALDGYVIAQISDIHMGPYVGERVLGEGLALVRKARADLLAITGDLVDFDATLAPRIAAKLAAVAPRDGAVAVLGNHDYYSGAHDVLSALRAAGIVLLVNEGRVWRPNDGGGFALLGVDDLAAERRGREGPRLDRAVASVPADLPRILLSHQPPTIHKWPGQVALQLSGHTHGGQVNPGGMAVNWLFDYVAGLYRVGETTLYVNRGFGTVGIPARIGVPPEVTRIVLVSA
jgi:predicted MPP superfamily phosphohydrolase